MMSPQRSPQQKPSRSCGITSSSKKSGKIQKEHSRFQNAHRSFYSESFIDNKLKQLALEAKERMAGGEKQKALAIMKKRRMYANELTKISNVKMTLETQAIQLESAAGTADAFQAMSAGTAHMNEIRTHMGGVEQVDDMMMDMQEEFQMQEEVGNAIGQSIDPLMGAVGDDDLLAELEGLNNESLMEQFDVAEGKKTHASKLSRRKNSKQKDGDDLKKLEAELAIGL